jgi:tripartite-type tricarboxylate transporter receptor subunit TctC
MKSLFVGVALGWLAAFGSAVGAQDYPTKPISLIVPYAAGGPADSLSRMVVERLSKDLGQQVIIENITGAGGTLGAARGAAAVPDGYTMVLASNGTHAAAPALYPNLKYHPIDSHELIGMISRNPIAVVARKDLPANTLREFVDYVGSKTPTVTNATGGVGSVSQIACIHFKAVAKLATTEVPYRGTGPAIQDLLGGRVDFVCDQVANVMSYVAAGSLKAYAVASTNRSASMPGVPTTAEAGLPGYRVTVWFALMFPKGTPAPIVARMNTALDHVLDDPTFSRRIEDLGGEVPGNSQRGPEYLRTFVQSEMDLWVPLLKAAGVTGN